MMWPENVVRNSQQGLRGRMSKDSGSVKDQIRQFVVQHAQHRGVATLADDELLVQNGVIDSLAIFRLVAFLEETFAVRILDEEIHYENFQSINGIERFVLSKLRGTPHESSRPS